MPHGKETSLSRLLQRILSASFSLDLCVFAFSNINLRRAVLALHSRGVAIRVLTDKDYAAITGSQIGVLRKAGEGNRSDYFLNHYEVYVTLTVTVTNHLYTKKSQKQAQGDTFSPYIDIITEKRQILLQIQEG